MSTTVAVPVCTPEPGERMVPALLAGNLITVPCPSYCTVDHVADKASMIEDIAHAGEPVSVSVPVGVNGAVERVLSAFISSYPFLADPAARGPVLALDATGSGEIAELSKLQARTVVDQMRAHVDALAALVESMQDAPTSTA